MYNNEETLGEITRQPNNVLPATPSIQPVDGFVDASLRRDPDTTSAGMPQSSTVAFVPLPAALFQRAFWEEWVPSHPPLDQSELTLDGRPIDLYQLHVEVMNAGGYEVVNREHSWPSIQAQLGFDQCAGDEPGRAGRDSLPQNRFSDHIRHVYERFLLDFDQQYALQQVRAQDRMNGPAASVSLQGDVPQSQSAGMQSASTQLMQLQLQSATERVERHRAEIPGLTPVASRIAPIPDDLIAEYTATFETLQSMLDEVESQLPLYAVFMNDESIRKIMLMINAGQLQSELLARSPPQCSMPLQLVQSMITQMQQLNRMAQVMLRSMRLTS